MDDLVQIDLWLRRRDWLVDSARYAAPEEQESIWLEIQRSMRRVVLLMGRVKWEHAGPAA